MKKEYWIARDKDGTLILSEEEPYKHNLHTFWSVRNSTFMEIKGFPKVKWEDKTPTKVKVTIEVI